MIPPCPKCGTIAFLEDHPCSRCGGTVWIHVANDPTRPGHGHHDECTRCLALEVVRLRDLADVTEAWP